MNTQINQKNLWIVAVVAMIAGVFLLYGKAIVYDYVWDDLIWLNTLAKYDGRVLHLAFFEPFLVGAVYWRPLGELSVYFQPGENPQYFHHALNIVLHALNVVLIAVLGYKAKISGKLQFSGWIFLLLLAMFAFHPAFVEPVVWVSGRFDLLMTSFFLFALIAYTGMENKLRRDVAVALLYSCALLTKETAILFIPLWMIFMYFYHGAASLRRVVSAEKNLLLVLLVCTFVYLVFRALVLGGTGGELILNGAEPLFSLAKIYKVLTTIGAYLALLIFPFKGLSTLYPQDVMLANLNYPVVGVLFVLATVFFLARTGVSKAVGVLFLTFLLSLALVLNIVPTGFPHNLIQNRYLYPSVALLLVYLAVSSVAIPLSVLGKKTFTALGVLWVVFAALNINVTVPLWRSIDSLSNWLMMENPNNPYAANMRGTYLLNGGYIEAAIETVGDIAVQHPTFGGYKILGDGHFVLGKCNDARVYYDYAFRLSESNLHRVDSLLGQYRILKEKDSVAAGELREQAIAYVADNPRELGFLMQRLAKLEKDEVVCLDETPSPSPEPEATN